MPDSGETTSHEEGTMRRNGSRREVRHDLVALTLAAAAAAISTNAPAAADIFAKIGDIKGESIDAKHQADIDVISWSWGVTGPQRKTPACPHDFIIDKYDDAASPLLIAAAAQATANADAKITVRKSGGDALEYLVLTFKNVVISEIASKAGITLDRPMETLSFSYSSATINYKPQKLDGSLGAEITATVGPSCPAP
jgi:type VI secretion system secreted protein Hcp